MWLKSLHVDELSKFLFDAIIPIVSGHQQGCAIVTYRTDNKEAAVLIKKSRRSVAACFFGYWQNIMGYRLEMVQKLMESLDIGAALLARFSDFDPSTLTVKTTLGDVDKQLDSAKANFGIDQRWNADLEDEDGERVDVVGHRKALAMTLRDPIKDVDNATCSGPSRRWDFLHSPGQFDQQLGGYPSTYTTRKGPEKHRAC